MSGDSSSTEDSAPMLESDPSITVVERYRTREEARTVPVLLVVGDSDRLVPARAARVLPFEATFYIGRRAPADAQAPHWVVKDPLVSAQHCRIQRDASGFKLKDLGSRNGTVVDGLFVKDTARLRDGSLIFVGAQIAVFRIVAQRELEAIEAEGAEPFGPLATASPSFALVCRTLRKLATSNCEILLVGETGVGKEVYARAVHEASGRSGRFVAINCAALPRELVESELFGYVRGAHSQARDSKKGLFEEAERGTLLLDEIGEMAPELQSKLLRFLQDREVTPLGGIRGRRIDVRVLAATNRTAAPTASGLGLRPDLAARLGAEPIRIPALRHRVEDLGALAARFLGAARKPLEPAAFQALALYGWPGNVRELEKALYNATLLARDAEVMGLEHLPTAVAQGQGRLSGIPAAVHRSPAPTPGELEALMIRFAGNMLRIARELDRKPALVYKWCRRYKLDPDRYRSKE